MRSVQLWWALLSLAGAINIALWIRALRRGAPDPETRWQLALCAAYVFGCAFRSFLPRADVQRITVWDAWPASVFVGRSVATIAELSFIAQIALTLRWLARDVHVRWVATVSYAPLLMITAAETFSWYAVLSTNYLGNTCEESLWTLTAIVVIVGALGVRSRYAGRARALISAAIMGFVGYVTFMCCVDVRMYFTRWRADEHAGRAYLPIARGVVDLIHRRVVTFSLDDWRTEIPWMSLYFTCAVWFSLALVAAAQHRARRRAEALVTSTR